MRILWVENHARFIAVSLPIFFKDHDVAVVPSVRQALERLANDNYDVVISDYDLDDGKGTEVVEAAIALSNRPLIIAASAHADGNAKLLNAGAQVICSKANFKKLEEILNVFQKRQANPANEKIEAFLRDSRRDIIAAAETKLGRPLMEQELLGINHERSGMILEALHREISSDSRDAEQAIETLKQLSRRAENEINSL